MRWYVSNAGNTVGPMETADVQRGIREGDISAEMYVRDEHGQWTTIEQSPFATILPKTPTKPQANNSTSSAFSEYLGIGVFLAVGGIAIARCNSDEQRPRSYASTAPATVPDDPRLDAWIMCQTLVEKRLKSPGTADYGALLKGNIQTYDKTITVLPNRNFACKGWVDSQNTYGAIVRTSYDLVIHQDGDMWTIEQINQFE